MTLAACGGSDDGPAPAPAPVAVAPTITAAPAATTVTEGDSASFSVTATGTAPLAYQWQRNGVAVAGATAATYAFVTALGDDNAQVRVVVSNSAGSATSATALLRVNPRPRPPVLTTQPVSMTIAELNTVTLTVAVEGTPPFAYQWQRSPDGVAYADIAGATSASYTTPVLSRADTGVRYRVIVSNAAGPAVTSEAAQITVNADAAVLAAAGGTVSGDNDAIRITVPAGALLGPTRFRFTALPSFPAALPANYVALPNSSFRIDVEGAGIAPNQPVSVRLAAAVQGALAMAAKANGPVTTDERAVRMRATPLNFMVQQCAGGPDQTVITQNLNAPTGETATVLCTPVGGTGSTNVGGAQPQAAVLPTITTQPTDAQVPVGGLAFFTVAASGPDLRYQWLRNGSDISGATAATYVVAVAQADFGARFSVLVSNRFGTEISRPARLSEGTPPPPPVSLWSSRTATAYASGLGAPVAVADTFVTVQGGVLRLGGVDALASNVLGSPFVAGGPPGLTGLWAIFYLERPPGSACAGAERLRVIGLQRDVETLQVVRSQPVLLAEGCFAAPLAAARSARGFEYAVARNAAPTAPITTGLATFRGEGAQLVGEAGPSVPLPLSAQCSDGGFFTERSLSAAREGYGPTPVTGTAAVLAFGAFAAGGGWTTCAATMSPAGVWSEASAVLDNGALAGPPATVTAMDTAGNALIAASRLNGSTNEMALAYRPASASSAAPAGGWVAETPLPASAQTRPDLAFDAAGNATLIYRSATGSPAYDAIFAVNRSAAGTWGARVAVSPQGVDTLFPRLTMAGTGSVVAFYQARVAGTSLYNLMETTRDRSVWREPAAVQLPDATIGASGATAPRYFADRDGALGGLQAFWLETVPAGTDVRIAGANKQR
jgi:hypothetical protein